MWTSDNLTEKLHTLELSERKAALVAQLQYHKKVLNARGNASLFYKWSNNKEFHEENLKTNLVKVLEINSITTENVQSTAL